MSTETNESIKSEVSNEHSENGHTNGHSNGHSENGHSTNEHSENGHTNGHSNGHSENGHSTNGHSENGHSNGHLEAKMKLLKLGTDDKDTKDDKLGKTAHSKRTRDEEEFHLLVHSYGEHQRWMQLSFMSVEQFLEETEQKRGMKLREMKPTDVNELSIVELSGLMYWIDKQTPYTKLTIEDKAALLKRYSVRKLSLDHFYRASKHPEYVARREFVMNNGTFVPANRTGFELPEDDIQQIEAKRMTFARTFDRFWNNVIIPFMKLDVNDAEVTFIHIMMLWSTRNDEHVTARTQAIMADRRNWALDQLYRWYVSNERSSETAEDRLDHTCENWGSARGPNGPNPARPGPGRGGPGRAGPRGNFLGPARPARPA